LTRTDFHHWTLRNRDTCRLWRIIGVLVLAEEFKAPQYRVMIVADKFQTEFDQPLLCDACLSGFARIIFGFENMRGSRGARRRSSLHDR
jgi:hypothetical protein